MATNVENNAVVSQMNSKYISIKPENGETFNAGQKIIYNIEPSIGYIKRDSYLVFDIANNTSDNGRYSWTSAGVNGIIKQINIYSKETGVLLENLNNYNQWCSIENQYRTDDKNQLAIKEGVRLPCSARRNTTTGKGTWSSVSEQSSPQITSNGLLSPVTTTGEAVFMTKRYCVPLRCGIFRHWDDEKLIPILNFGGLRIEIILETPQLALQRMSGTRTGVPLTALDITGVNGSAGGATARGYTTIAQATVDNTITINGTPGNVSSLREAIELSGFAVGNKIVHRFTATAGGAVVIQFRNIVSFALNGANLQITVDGAAFPDRGVGNVFLDLGNANGGGVWAGSLAVEPSYKVVNTEFRLCVVAPTSKQASQLTASINYEYTTYDLFLDNVPTSTLRHQVPIHSVASKAKCIMSMLYDVSTEKHVSSQNYYAGLQKGAEGEQHLSYNNEIVFFINNKLYPLRAYDPRSRADRVLNLNENVKAFKAINTPIKSNGEATGGNLEDSVNTSLISRELARDQFVFDLRNSEPELRLGFTGARTQNLKVNTYVWSKKVVSTSSSGVVVIY